MRKVLGSWSLVLGASSWFLVLCAQSTVATAQPVSFERAVADLRHDEASIRVLAVKLLRELGQAEAVGPLAPLMADADDEVQIEAIGAELTLLCVEPIPDRRRVAMIVERQIDEVAETAFRMGPVAVAPGTRVPPSVITYLARAAGDDKPLVRREAIYALGVLGQGRVSAHDVKPVIAALGDVDPELRVAALRVLGRLQDTASGHRMVAAMNDSDREVRLAAMEALGAVRFDRGVHSLIERFEHHRGGREAVSALDALAHIAKGAVVPFLRKLLSDKRETFRRLAFEGFARSGASIPATELDVKRLHESMPEVQVAIDYLLLKSGRKSALESMVNAAVRPGTAKQAEGYLIEAGPSLGPLLLPYLQDPDHAIRAMIARVLGIIGGPETIEQLQPLTKDEVSTVAAAASHAVRRLTRGNTSS